MDSQRRRKAEADLKATVEDLAHDARRVEAIEELKGSLEPDDPRTPALAAESEQLTSDMAAKAKMEAELRRQADAEPSN